MEQAVPFPRDGDSNLKALLKTVPIIFHCLPLVPLAYGRHYATAATLLLIALPYIKVKKLRVLRDEMRRAGAPEMETEEIRKVMDRWQILTFYGD